MQPTVKVRNEPEAVIELKMTLTSGVEAGVLNSALRNAVNMIMTN